MTEERYNELKLAIFEKCEDGEITESEKGSLLEALNSVMESTAYNRKADEYEKELQAQIDKIVKLQRLLNSGDLSDKQKESIKKKIDDLNAKGEDIQEKKRKVIGRLKSSKEEGKQLGELKALPDAYKHTAYQDFYLDAGKNAKKTAKTHLGISKPNAEKEPGKYLKLQKAMKESVMESFCEDEITSEQALNIMEAVDAILS